MKIKMVIYLSVIGSIFTIGTNLTYGEEILVFHDRPIVSILSTSTDGNPNRKEFIKDAALFRINENGYFTLGIGHFPNLLWYKGRIDSSFNIAGHQTLASIPPDVVSVDISEDGKRIAWVLKSGFPNKSELTIEEYTGKESKVLHKISVDGMIPEFSFSPDGDMLAYFWGPPEAAIKDGFSLMLLDLKNPKKPPIEIAPPSFNTGRLNPGRSIPPLWSPTGEFILFEAEYQSENVFKVLGGRYVASIDGRILEPFPGGNWDQDGKYLRRLKRIGDLDSGEYFLSEINIFSREVKEYPDRILKISGLNFNVKLSPSGRKVAYVVNKEIFVYDIMEKNTVSYGTSQSDGEFFWISPTD